MLPVLVHFKFKRPGRPGFGLWFPVIIVWIILAALLLVLLPFVLLAALSTWRRGPGRALLFLYPMFFSVLWNLSGLHLEVDRPENDILIEFI